MTLNQSRLVRLNDRPIDKSGDFVLYWMQMQRRFSCTHSLDYAIKCANELDKPLIVYEGLRMDYPWASARLHRFVLDHCVHECAAQCGSTHGARCGYLPRTQCSPAESPLGRAGAPSSKHLTP